MSLQHAPRIWIDNYDPQHCGPNSYNLRLAPELKIYNLLATREMRHNVGSPCWGDSSLKKVAELSELDMAQDNPTTTRIIPKEGVVLLPGCLYLGLTWEYTETFNCVPYIDGRSSVGRLGLSVHVTAGAGDVGFCGRFTLELTVVHPLRVYAGARICQIKYYSISTNHVPYAGKYQGDRSISASRMHQEFKL
jgi:dCTP deaminase